MLETLLCQEIRNKGPLSQSYFMEIALQHPLYGYYRTQEAVARDFITSPEISQVFGELIGIWAIDYYQKREKPRSISLVEFGPGRGTLMVDFLRASKVSKKFSEALNLFLIETNPILQDIQRKRLACTPKWSKKFEDILFTEDPLIIIANEFFDALPVKYFVRKDNIIYERYVILKKNKLVFSLNPLQGNEGPDEGWEESLATEDLIDQICKKLLKQTGVFLCIDYGYEEGKGDSLQALYQGKPSEPLLKIGQSDLTCHVNFGRMKEIALSQGLGVLGPISQGRFLKNLGINTRISLLKQINSCQSAGLEAAATRLTHPQQMGTHFKVMAIFSPPQITPLGFD